MKAMMKRLRRLEAVAAPDQSRPAAHAILEARRQLGSDYEPIAFAPNSFAGCQTVAGIRASRRRRQ